MLIYFWGFLYNNYLRFWLKWLLRLLTQKCELQRVLEGSKAGARRTLSIGNEGRILRNAVHVQEAEVEKCVRDVMKEKKIKQKDTGYVWSPNRSSSWQIILIFWHTILFYTNRYFSKRYTDEARQILSHSHHPKLGYSYAIVGINLTEMAYSLLKNGALKSHLYNMVFGLPQMEHFHQFYCYLVYEFDKFWFEEEPESIMHFNHYREKFHEKIKGLLLDCNVILTLGD
ncbi:ELMD2 protein, partial [Eolophus roseicapillus]|nr:ELMD2 protein [Eolophus roseicapilla]